MRASTKKFITKGTTILCIFPFYILAMGYLAYRANQRPALPKAGDPYKLQTEGKGVVCSRVCLMGACQDSDTRAQGFVPPDYAEKWVGSDEYMAVSKVVTVDGEQTVAILFQGCK